MILQPRYNQRALRFHARQLGKALQFALLCSVVATSFVRESGKSLVPNHLGQKEPDVHLGSGSGAFYTDEVTEDLTEFLTKWYTLEAPLRRLLKQLGVKTRFPSRDAEQMQKAISRARRNQLATETKRRSRIAQRLQKAANATCAALSHLKVIDFTTDCPEVIASDSDIGSILGLGLVWSVAQEDLSEGIANHAVTVVHPQLVQELTDSELRGVLGLHIGRLLLTPTLFHAWPTWVIWALARHKHFYRELSNILKIAGLSAHSDNFMQHFSLQVPAIRLRKAPPHTTRLQVGLEASSLGIVTWALRRRVAAIEQAADRFAIIAAGSVLAAENALDKTEELTWQRKEERFQNMRKWAASTGGQRLLSRSRACLETHQSDAFVAGSALWARMLLTLIMFALAIAAASFLSPLLAFALLGFILSVLMVVVISLSRLQQQTCPALGESLQVDNMQRQKSTSPFIWAAGMYLSFSVLAIGRCLFGSAGQDTVDSLIVKVLPAAAEAAAGAALLARCSEIVRKIPISELDKDLRSRWATALRGISAKIADLRRLAGVGTGSAATNFEHGKAERVCALCSKLEFEVRRTLAAEMHWMRQAIELEQEFTLKRALFWWLHDDGEGGALGSPRLSNIVEQAWESGEALEKLQCPSLISSVRVDLPRPQALPDSLASLHTTAELEEQHQQVDALRSALNHAAAGTPDARGEWPEDQRCFATLIKVGTRYARQEACVERFLQHVAKDSKFPIHRLRDPSGRDELSPKGTQLATSASSCSHSRSSRLYFMSFIVSVGALFATAGCFRAGFFRRYLPEVTCILAVHVVLFWNLWRSRLPQCWALLELHLAAVAARREDLTAGLVEGGERLLQLKALVVLQGVRTAQNLDYLALCVQAEALRQAAAARGISQRRTAVQNFRSLLMEPKFRDDAEDDCQGKSSEDFTFHCLQLLYAVLPRHGRQGQRQVSSDHDIYQAMDWFEKMGGIQGAGGSAFSHLSRVKSCESPSHRLRSLQVALATCQRDLWMMFRLCDVRAMAQPPSLQGTLSCLLVGQLGPIVLERRLNLDSIFQGQASGSGTATSTPRLHSSRSRYSSQGSDDSGRILGDLDSTTGSHQDEGSGDDSSQASGTVRRILASEGGSSGSRGGRGFTAGSGRRALDFDNESVSDASNASSFAEMDRDGGRRILAASEVSDASSESATSAGFKSFAYTSMWSGMSGSAASSSTSLAEDMLTNRRPLLESYANALRPLFMTRGDLAHLLAKFPKEVLLGPGRNCAAHRELLDELFGSFVVWVKTPDRRGKIKLAFGASFEYSKEVYSISGISTSLKIVAHGVRRTGNEPFPVVHEEEEEDERSQCAASVAPGDSGTAAGVLEFEEVVVPLTEVSSRELFLAELMQSDQCQLLASLSQGSHSRYGQRALRRRRRTLRHVREATNLLSHVPT